MLIMSWRHGKSCGWASFDCKQQKNHNLDPEFGDEHFPPMPTPFYPCGETVMQHNDLKYPSISFPSMVIPLVSESHDSIEQLGVAESSNSDHLHKQLKSFHCWAENSLINDIMEAVDNDFFKASSLLTEMVSIDENIAEELYHGSGNSSSDKDLNNKQSSLREKGINLKFNSDILNDDYVCGGSKFVSDDEGHLKFDLKQKNCIPLEPEWEEDDIYFRHRRVARSMARSACYHSKAAANAFTRGDHFSAKIHSLTAHEKSMVAKKLNANAAKKILSIRNGANDIWRLDLHGLHAAEAVAAVQEQLHNIELNLSSSSSLSGTLKTEMIARSESSSSCVDKVRVRQTCLQIITGIGNHSRGEAALPLAVRSFLDKNGCCFSEPKPGVISVRPKFRGL